MNRVLFLNTSFKISCLIIACLTLSCQEPKWESLLDTEMSQWDTYLSYKHQYGYNGSIPLDADSVEVAPVGLNPEGYDVFRVIEEEGEPVLHVSGEYYGCVITKNSYDNYHLKVEFRWGEQVWPPREHLLKDAGILYHSVGPMGAEYWRSWMLSQEFQIMEGHMGDYWSQANSAIDIRAYLPEGIMSPVADDSQPFLSFGQDQSIKGYCMRSANFERPTGEWNTLDLICYEGKSLHIVNGEVVMILDHSRQMVDGKPIPLVKGRIQLQSEAAEVFYKGIQIRSLDAMPTEYQHYYE
ncbi:DUF1080 domain-containing protein [Reichenbachiella sp. MSK19-1]|uniref:3-keto-disaccharide hydrolase n=1 Tax=Reichenbachiella sp. MSK19-1 TaxID=1897631 RepID=UPI000E6D0F5D|nr:DUF1080 domain-containing protein [Reichenbachiella sp. MSK19-1]RJE75397.1 hypothetical protein BGP76_13810 [Reichenbachiella sp. MSK19-1]